MSNFILCPVSYSEYLNLADQFHNSLSRSHEKKFQLIVQINMIQEIANTSGTTDVHLMKRSSTTTIFY